MIDLPAHAGKGEINGTPIKKCGQLKSICAGLPDQEHFQIDNESLYLLKIAQCIELLKGLPLCLIPYAIEAQSLGKLILQLSHRATHLEVVLCLLSMILKGQPVYAAIVERDLYEIVLWLLGSKGVVRASLRGLVGQIVKWYSIDKAQRVLVHKYDQLQNKLVAE